MTPTGFSTTVRAPARSAFMEILSEESSMLSAITTIGVGCSDMIRRVASSPSMPGRRISIEITSGCTRPISWSASSAEPTAAATTRRGSRAMMWTSS